MGWCCSQRTGTETRFECLIAIRHSQGVVFLFFFLMNNQCSNVLWGFERGMILHWCLIRNSSEEFNWGNLNGSIPTVNGFMPSVKKNFRVNFWKKYRVHICVLLWTMYCLAWRLEKVVGCVKAGKTATERSESDTWETSEGSIIHSYTRVIELHSDAQFSPHWGQISRASIEMWWHEQWQREKSFSSSIIWPKTLEIGCCGRAPFVAMSSCGVTSSALSLACGQSSSTHSLHIKAVFK